MARPPRPPRRRWPTGRLALLALLIACSPLEDAYLAREVGRQGDACVTLDGQGHLEPGWVADDAMITERTVVFDLRFACGVPVRIEGLVCTACDEPDLIEHDGVVRLELPEKVPVGQERTLEATPIPVAWHDEAGDIVGAVGLEVRYDPAPDEGCL